MDYKQSVYYVENAALFGSKKNGLENITRLLGRLGNPHHTFKSVHVAGTNGKGSTCAFVDSILRQSDLKVGLFTSPYLEKFTERMMINDAMIPEDDFARLATKVRKMTEDIESEGYDHATFFELITTIAFCYFAEQRVDIAVIEVGLGGRLDATNVLDPELCIITSIGYDHVKVLGNTIESIAGEKAGIIKPGCPVVVYPQPYAESYPVILDKAKNQFAPIYSVADSHIVINNSSLTGQSFDLVYQDFVLDNLNITMLGKHQVLNAVTAVIGIIVLAQTIGLDIKAEHIYGGLKNAVWPGRLEVISHKPLIIIDGAHNKQGAKSLEEALSNFLPMGDNILLTGVLLSKDAKEIADELSMLCSSVIVTSPSSRKNNNPSEYGTHFSANGLPVTVQPDTELAFKSAFELAHATGRPLIIAGSLYLAGLARSFFNGIMDI